MFVWLFYMVQLCICPRTLCSCDYNDNERNICMCFKLPLLPYDHLSKTLLSHRLVLFSKPASHLLLLLCSSPVRIILFNEKAKNGGKKTPHNNQNTKPLLARPLESILSQFFLGECVHIYQLLQLLYRSHCVAVSIFAGLLASRPAVCIP